MNDERGRRVTLWLRDLFPIRRRRRRHLSIGLVREQARHPSPLEIAMEMTTTQEVDLFVKFTDARDLPAKVEGVPVWDAGDLGVVSVSPAADGMSAVVRAAGVTGAARVTCTGDADFGAGVTPVELSIDFSIVEPPAPQATGGTISPGQVREQGFQAA